MSKNLLEGVIIEEKTKIEGIPNTDYMASSIEFNKKNMNFDSILKNIKEQNLEALKESIEDIQILIEQRKSLSKEIINQIMKMEIALDNELLELQKVRTEKAEEVVKAKSDMRLKKIELGEMRLNEKLNEWRDIALLKRELRDRIKEFKEEQSRSAMLESIID